MHNFRNFQDTLSFDYQRPSHGLKNIHNRNSMTHLLPNRHAHRFTAFFFHVCLPVVWAISTCWLFSCSNEKKVTGTNNSLQLTRADSNLFIARQNFLADSSEENAIWYGRRLAYLNRYDTALAVYTRAIQRFPESYKLYRHRGHRYISTRQFDLAIQDLERAAQLAQNKPIEIEPDGIPNKLNKPISSGHFNVWYHLGLAYYLKGDFEKALSAYLNCMKVSDNDDSIVATADWLYMTYRRLGKTKEAEVLLKTISNDMTIIENDSYFIRLRMYKGLLPPDSVLSPNPNHEDYDLSLATQGYGVGHWYWLNNEKSKAKAIFEKIMMGKSKNAFGYIAAETELKRLAF
jgi:tetratricopeptide (TPR) repeat protein